MDLHYKQEVTVGALVLVGVALFVAGTMWLGGRGLSPAPVVRIAFPDAGTLKRGSPVKVSGDARERVGHRVPRVRQRAGADHARQPGAPPERRLGAARLGGPRGRWE